MKAIFFDLGDTLEANGVLVPRAVETLNAVKAMKDTDGTRLRIGLISDYKEAATKAEVKALQREYYSVLAGLKIRALFEPVSIHVTLSTEVGVRKPNQAIFRKALDKVSSTRKLQFKNAAFITENAAHIEAVRQLGMKGICVKGGPAPTTWDVETLPEIIPLLEAWLKS